MQHPIHLYIYLASNVFDKFSHRSQSTEFRHNDEYTGVTN